MKKIILLSAAILLSMPFCFGQGKVKADKDSFLKKIEKSDADIANDKKASNPTTWINRGKLFYDAETAVTGLIYQEMPENAVTIILGQPTGRKEAVINEKPYNQVEYAPYMIAYSDVNGILKGWKLTYVIDENAIEKSVEAYNKAYELGSDKKAVTDKVIEGLKNNYDILYKYANVEFELGDYAKAADIFSRAYEISQYPGFNDAATAENVPALLYDTGVAYYFGGKYDKSVEYLTKAQQIGYEKNGEVYYLLYHAYKAQAPNNEKEILEKAKEIVEYGLMQYPDNANIIEAVTDVYVSLGDDPRNIVPIVEKAIENEPNSAALWNGLGRLYDELGDLLKSAEAFEHVAELAPDNAGAHFSVGLQYLREADVIAKKINSDSSIATQDELDAALDKTAFVLYRKGIPPLERAHELDPDDIATVELLKSVTFILRDEPGMSEKNKKYQALFDQMK